MTVSIVDLTSGISTVAWLCEGHQAARKSDGWTVKAARAVDHPCDDCIRDVRAPEAVDFVATTPDARLPTAQECPPPRKIPPWPKTKKPVTAKREPTTWESDEEAA